MLHRQFGKNRDRNAVDLADLTVSTLRYRLIWVLTDVVGLFSVIVGPFSRYVGRRGRIFSVNLGRKRRMLSGPAVYVLGPLQIAGQTERINLFRDCASNCWIVW
jgi:hypothetical protein